MNPKDFVEIKYGQWWEQVSQGATKKKRLCAGIWRSGQLAGI
jgi:hypothetical protein